MNLRTLVVVLLAAVAAQAQAQSQPCNQGAPGHQGPWGVYIQRLPDGGGGNNTVPCPLTVVLPSGSSYVVGCDAAVTDAQDGGGSVTSRFSAGVASVSALDATGGYHCSLTSGANALGGGMSCYDGTITGNLHFGSFGLHDFSVDVPFCFQDGTCQSTAAGAGFFQDAGASGPAGSIINNNLGPVLFTQDNTVLVEVKNKNGGAWLGTLSNHDFYIGAHDEFGAIGMAAAGGITVYDNISFNNHELTSIGNASAGGSAASLNQVQSDLSITGLTLPGVTAANDLVIGSATGASGINYSFVRYRINLTCLVAGVGAGNTTISLKDSTAATTLVTATEACACTPGAVVSAISTGSSTDSDQFNVALGASASTDCATYPLFIANANLTRK